VTSLTAVGVRSGSISWASFVLGVDVEGPASFDAKYLDVPSSRISFATATEPPADPDPVLVPVDIEVEVDENVNVAEADEAIPEPPSDKPAGPSGKFNFNPEDPSPSVNVLLIPRMSCRL
jgi:hypothetical protein